MLASFLLLGLALAEEPVGGASSADAEATPEEPDPALMGEYYRLSEEMAKLAKRQVWSGVARHYEQLEALGVPLDYDDHVAGAMAARDQGEVMLAYERLQAAARIDGTREVIEWLWSIDTAYGRVSLATVPEGPSTLSIEQMPMLPDQRAAVEAAVRQVQDTGRYEGMLPAGTYTFADQTFTVTPGPKAVSITVSPVEDGRRKR